jgi:hypothetical protein
VSPINCPIEAKAKVAGILARKAGRKLSGLRVTGYQANRRFVGVVKTATVHVVFKVQSKET